jgi:hypothetical protein
MLIDPAGRIREVQFPVTDPAASVDEMLTSVTGFTQNPPAGAGSAAASGHSLFGTT